MAAAAIAVSREGRRRLAPSNFESLITTWEQLAFWASSLIFLFAAMRTPELLVHATWRDFALLAALIAAALAARALTLYGLIPLLSFARLAQPIGTNYKLFMLWGGMRGAVSLALALAVTEEMSVPPEIRQFVGVLATGFVLFTLLVNGPTMRPLMRLLKLNDAPPGEIALRERVIGLSLGSIRAGSRASRASTSSRLTWLTRLPRSTARAAAAPPRSPKRTHNCRLSCGPAPP